MKAIFTAVCIGALAALNNDFAVAECANDITPTTRAALLESAEALTRCSAFYHEPATAALLSQDTEKIEHFKLWSGAARESIIAGQVPGTSCAQLSSCGARSYTLCGPTHLTR
jgi:hypothetical protein